MPLDGEYLPSTSDWARKQAELIESSGGTAGLTLDGRRVIVLTTRGARTGALRKTALMRVEHEGEYAVVASRGGAPTHPQWYFNLLSHPEVELQDGTQRHDYVAHEAQGAEREEWWSRAVDAFPPYADYQEKTERVIPVFILSRAS